MKKQQTKIILILIFVVLTELFIKHSSVRAADLCVNMCQTQQGPAQQACLNLCKSSQGHESQSSLTEAWNSPKAQVTEYGSKSLSANEQNVVKSSAAQGVAPIAGAPSSNGTVSLAASAAAIENNTVGAKDEKDKEKDVKVKKSVRKQESAKEGIGQALSQEFEKEKGQKYLLYVLTKQTKEDIDARQKKAKKGTVRKGILTESTRANKDISQFFETKDDKEPRCSVEKVFTLLADGLWRQAISQANECYNPLL